MTTVTALPDAASCAEARAELAGVAQLTPVLRSRVLSQLVGGDVWLKCENLQRGGSFKIRGAYTRIARLSSGQRARGVVAASAGNHAQGVAIAAARLGVRATVFMPVGAALPKAAATRDYGAEVRHAGATVDESLVAARAFADETGAVLVHPFDHPDVVAGQASLGAEVLEQVPGARTIIAGVGGGGLLAGITLAVAHAGTGTRVIGVQAAGAAAWPASLDAGQPVAIDRMTTMADGIAVARPGEVPYSVVSPHVPADAAVCTVDEDHVSQAVLLVLERAKLLVEPAGAVSVAALLAEVAPVEPPVVAVLTGGNVDPLVLHRILRHGLAAAGRYLSVRVRIIDRPGALSALLAAVAAADANLVAVEHRRADPALRVDEVEVALQLETRGPGHRTDVLAALATAGYRVIG
ncbi:MAG: threonine ammonia-lyase [Actinomycetales bacterium]